MSWLVLIIVIVGWEMIGRMSRLERELRESKNQ